jgi:hypothetical protein
MLSRQMTPIRCQPPSCPGLPSIPRAPGGTAQLRPPASGWPPPPGISTKTGPCPQPAQISSNSITSPGNAGAPSRPVAASIL